MERFETICVNNTISDCPAIDAYSTNATRIKFGEIFQVTKENYIFVCIHCSEEFQYFTELILHVEEHLIETLETSEGLKAVININPDEPIKFEIDVEDIKTECDVINDEVDNNTGWLSFCKENDNNNSNDVSHNLHISQNEIEKSVPNITTSLNNENEFILGKNYEQFGNSFRCLICKHIIKYKRGLKIHLSIHTNTEKKLSCPICEQKFTLISYVQSHIIKRHKQRYTYEMVLEAQNNYNEQKIIVIKRPREKLYLNKNASFECFICKRTFRAITPAKTMYNVRHHIKTVHDQSEMCGSYECYLCKKNYGTRKLLRQHMKTHTIKPLLCLLCGSFFKTSAILNRHMEIHNIDPNNPLKCDICDRTFLLKRYLQEHYRKMHQNIMKERKRAERDKTSFKCPICEGEFSSRRNFIGHKRVHDPHGFFNCVTCGKKLSNRYAREHQLIHTNDMRHQCAICGRTFAIA